MKEAEINMEALQEKIRELMNNIEEGEPEAVKSDGNPFSIKFILGKDGGVYVETQIEHNKDDVDKIGKLLYEITNGEMNMVILSTLLTTCGKDPSKKGIITKIVRGTAVEGRLPRGFDAVSVLP